MGSRDYARLTTVQLKLNISSWSQVVLLTWVSAWMLAVPLFHVHAETDFHHGEAGHVHGGVVHTVFSPDLDGEFDTHHDMTDGSGTTFPSHVATFGHPAHASENVELGFSFLSNLTDRKLPKPLLSSGLVVESVALHVVVPNPSVTEDTSFTPSLPFFTRDIPSRAPPFPPQLAFIFHYTS
jgi:hypothetical protein